MNLDFRLPVCEVEERSILGAILENNPEAFDVVARHGLVSEDFFLQSHRMIHAVLVESGEAGEALDVLSVAGKLRDRGQLTTIGGSAYLASLIDGIVYDQKSLVSRVKRVQNASNLRRFISFSQAAIGQAAAAGAQIHECLELLQDSMLQIQAGSTELPTEKIASDDDYREWDSKRGQTLIGLTTGLRCLDNTTRGLGPSQYVIIAGRTGDGKTSLALQMAAASCHQDVPVLIFSLEMSRTELLHRLWAQESSVPFWKIRNAANISGDDKQRIRLASEQVSSWPLWVNEAATLTIQKLCSLARIAIRQHKIRLIVVDYVQLVSCPARDERERITKVSNSLRMLAKATGVPVLAVSQLARPRDGDANRRPNRFSLKESGSLENDAHLIVLTYRPTNSYDQPTGEDELIIAKQRHGPTGIETVYFKPEALKFYERTR